MISEKIKFQRKRNNFTQQQLADKLGTSRSNVNNWERNEGTPSLHQIIFMSYLFNSSIEYLIAKDDIFDEIVTNILTEQQTAIIENLIDCYSKKID